MPLLAGFSRRDITPSEPCFLVGYPHEERTSTGAHDSLFASALYLESDGVRLLLISLDLLFISAGWTRECRKEIAAATGIPAGNILIAATHTHSGPHTVEVMAWRDDPIVPPVDQQYLDFVREKAVDASASAAQEKQSAELAWTRAEVGGLVGGNRLDPEGPEDTEAGLLFVRKKADLSPLAVLSIYGMHPTVLHADTTCFSSDFIGYARREVEETFPGAGMVYLNGVCGNQSPRRVAREKTIAEAERLGRLLGGRMAKSLIGIRSFSSRPLLAAESTTLQLQGKVFPEIAEAEKALTAARENLARLGSADAAQRRTAECTVFGAEEVRVLAKAEAAGDAEELRQKYASVEVQALRIGGVIVAAWPGEFFVEYGLEAKARSGAELHIATMANGELQGYVVTPEAAAAGGYEAQMSLFPPAAGKQVIDATLELIDRLQ
ncbi:neutral/alkaline non-lysosomal ceramidase N-terminal domain-containing protein [Haloferula sp.]|uniref:neutral/alkaline non-lysosomal ceramidase N-terminal domain-containing protein n=1 Tax=Haloferula sp. TaxID=2497595 RepID=UPI003C76A516